MLNTIVNSVGIIAFACSGVFKGLKYNFDIFGITVLGIITACGGGIIRDLLVNEIPFVLKEDIYATLSFAGGIIYYICIVKMGIAYNTVVPFLFIILLFVRLVAIKYKLSLHFSNSKNGENKE